MVDFLRLDLQTEEQFSGRHPDVFHFGLPARMAIHPSVDSLVSSPVASYLVAQHSALSKPLQQGLLGRHRRI